MKVVNFKLTPKQYELFYEIFPKYRYIVATKGRRFGATFSLIRFAFLLALQNKDYAILWGDTTQQNISRYIDRYLLPFARNFDGWVLNKTERRLEFANGSYIDFRSADRPENWEGFGYSLVVLNEAGIILKNRYLWENAVRPMMLDNENSKAIIIGAPKGKNLFYELWKYAHTSGDPNWIALKYTTYDNPLINRKDIEQLERELPEAVVKQEIYGEFIDEMDATLFNFEDIEFATISTNEVEEMVDTITHIGVDVALGGRDKTVVTIINNKYVIDQKIIDLTNTFDIAQIVLSIAKNELLKGTCSGVIVNVEVDGLGVGVYNALLELNNNDLIDVYPVRMGEKPSKRGKGRFLNRRAELYFRLKQLLENGDLYILNTIPTLNELRKQMLDIRYENTNTSKLKIESKESFKDRNGGKSPDELDSLTIAINNIFPVYKV